jgi:hypothetical protein
MSKLVDVNKDFKVVFLGKCLGVGLRPRGGMGLTDDQHVCFHILVEDDGGWFDKAGGGISTYWLPELIQKLNTAQIWLEENATKYQYGYVFRE